MYKNGVVRVCVLKNLRIFFKFCIFFIKFANFWKKNVTFCSKTINFFALFHSETFIAQPGSTKNLYLYYLYTRSFGKESCYFGCSLFLGQRFCPCFRLAGFAIFVARPVHWIIRWYQGTPTTATLILIELIIRSIRIHSKTLSTTHKLRKSRKKHSKIKKQHVKMKAKLTA